MECAQALAWRTLKEGGADDATRLRYAFRRCLARLPAEAEQQELLNLLARAVKHVSEGWTDAKTVAGAPASRPLPPGATPTQLAAWTIVSRVLLNLDETVTKE